MPPPPLPANASSRDTIIKEILRLTFPSTALFEGLVEFSRALGAKGAVVPPDHAAKVQTEQDRLLKLSPAELSQTLQSLRAKAGAAAKAQREEKQKREQEKVAAKEAAKFYNEPAASADFALWTKADFWSFDEALALLLGKEPKVVTWAAIKQELEHRARFERESPLSSFLHTYRRLRTLGLRADAMTRAARLRPAEVIQWAQRVDLIEVPAALCKPSVPPPKPVSQVEPVQLPAIGVPAKAATLAEGSQASSTSGTMIKKAALLKRYATLWPTAHSDLAHASENGLAKAAKAVAHGYWNEEAAIHWAKQNGKMDAAAPDRALALDQLPRQIHRLGN